MRAYLSRTQQQAPVVFLLMDVWGFRDELFGIADDIARAGNTCVVPDFYHRQGIVLHEAKDEHGRARTLADLPGDHQERIRASLRALRDEEVVADVAATLESLKQLGLPSDRFGCVGYCMGGRHALRVAAAFPALFRASASLHGSDLVTSGPDSAHLGIPDIRGAFYCGFAERDPYASPSVLSALENAFSRSPATYQFSLHPGIHHGYALPERDVYDASATNTDWSAIRTLFAQHLNAA
jgi:carboxymethylenebutenolidase